MDSKHAFHRTPGTMVKLNVKDIVGTHLGKPHTHKSWDVWHDGTPSFDVVLRIVILGRPFSKKRHVYLSIVQIAFQKGVSLQKQNIECGVFSPNFESRCTYYTWFGPHGNLYWDCVLFNEVYTNNNFVMSLSPGLLICFFVSWSCRLALHFISKLFSVRAHWLRWV